MAEDDDGGPDVVYNLVFVLRNPVGRDVVRSYHMVSETHLHFGHLLSCNQLAKRLCAALRHEEQRRGYLTRELQLMLEEHDTAEQVVVTFLHS